jgi:hypothetical protein
MLIGHISYLIFITIFHEHKTDNSFFDKIELLIRYFESNNFENVPN